MATTAAAGTAEDSRSEYGVTRAYLIVALVALFGGVVMGLFQGLEHAGIDLLGKSPKFPGARESRAFHVMPHALWAHGLPSTGGHALNRARPDLAHRMRQEGHTDREQLV